MELEQLEKVDWARTSVRLTSHAYRRLGTGRDWHVAEELAQEAIEQVIDPNYKDFDPADGSLFKHLGSVVNGLIQNRGRKKAESCVTVADPKDETSAVRRVSYEALLYFLGAPFAHERMKLMQAAFGFGKSKGPKALYIYGATNNGKSSLTKFALKLLAGHFTKPLTNDDYRKRKLDAMVTMGGVFPAVFDDVARLSKAHVSSAFKGYWESAWRAEFPQPALAFTCNKATVPEWAKTRVLRVDFDVVFRDSAVNSARLNDLLQRENPIFDWVAHLSVARLAELGPRIRAREEAAVELLDDDLSITRLVLQDLYTHAGRELPSYFPRQPVHTLFNPEQRRWMEHQRLGKLELKQDGNTLRIEFAEDLDTHEVKELISYIPQEVKSRRVGHTLIVEAVSEFHHWLSKEDDSIWTRIKRWAGIA